MNISEMPQDGTWKVYIDDEQPDAVCIEFVEPCDDESGMKIYGFYMPRREALTFASSIIVISKQCET